MIELGKRFVPPYSFTGPYAGCYNLPEVAADARHVFMIYDVLCSWPFESALEIGSFNGATATAFVEAIRSGRGLGKRGIATFCDVSITDSLVDVVRHCHLPDRVRVTPQPSWQVLDSEIPFDFIYVDAAHDIDSVSLELKRLLKRRPQCVMAHDTSATLAGYSKCEGAALLAQTFREQADYFCIEDNTDRFGERTHRGLFLATRNLGLRERAAEIFRRWGA